MDSPYQDNDSLLERIESDITSWLRKKPSRLEHTLRVAELAVTLAEEYGVDPSRLSMDYKGDEEQPFSIVNEWNRAVVFYIKPHDASFTPTVEDKANDIKLNKHESNRLNQTDSKQTRTAY